MDHIVYIEYPMNNSITIIRMVLNENISQKYYL